MKKINFKYIVLIVVIMTVIGLKMYNVYELKYGGNIGFNSQELFINGGYKEAYNNATSKVKQDNQYLKDNNNRIESYNIDFEAAIRNIENGKSTEVLANLKDKEKSIKDKKLYKSDVQVILEREFLKLNISAYDMYENEGPDSSGANIIYQKIYNMEVMYDAFTNDLNIDEVEIGDNRFSRTSEITYANKRLSTISILNKILYIIVFIVICIIIYRFLSGKKVLVLIIIVGILCLYNTVSNEKLRRFHSLTAEENYVFSVSQNTNDEYYINFLPIAIIEEFVSNGGDLHSMTENGNEEQVDWSDYDSVQGWLNSDSSFSEKKITSDEETNLNALGRIDSYIEDKFGMDYTN